MGPAWVKKFKSSIFQNFVKFSFQNFIPIYFWKDMVLRRNMFDVFLCIYPKQLNKSYFDRFLKLSEPKSEREIP